MASADLLFLSACELRERFRRREVSPVEVAEACLRQIERLNPRVNAFLTVTAEEALRSARRTEEALMKGDAQGPLAGVPISVKDLIWTRGVRTTGGSLVYRDWVPGEDAVVVERVKRAGAVILGKTNTSEFGNSATTENLLGDDGRNPWDPSRTAGGSSGGAAAAVALGMGPLALGSDGGGSIRIPSAFCGVFGIKPTFGRVPNHGEFPGMLLFAQIGPIARTVRDAALLLQVISGHDPRDPWSLREAVPDFGAGLGAGVKGMRMAWSPDLGSQAVDPEVLEVTGRAVKVLEGLGAVVEEPRLDWPYPQSVFATMVLADSYAFGQELLAQADRLMWYTRRTLEEGARVMGHQYSLALMEMARFRSLVDDLFERYDVLLTPATAVPAFPVGQRPQEIGGRRVSRLWGPFPFCMPFNVTGQPAASVPCGVTGEGLPVGLQVVGRRGEEATVLRVAAALEEALPWAHRIPPMARG